LRDAYTHAGQAQDAAAVQSALQALKQTAPRTAEAAANPATAAETKTAAPPASQAPPAPRASAPAVFDPPAPAPPSPGRPAGGQPHHPHRAGKARPAAEPASEAQTRPADGHAPSRRREGGKGRRTREPLIGEICVARGWVTAEQVRHAADIQR